MEAPATPWLVLHVPPGTQMRFAVRLVLGQHRARPVTLGALLWVELAPGTPRPIPHQDLLAAPSIVQTVVVATLLEMLVLSAALMIFWRMTRVAPAPATSSVEALRCVRRLNKSHIIASI